MAARTVSIEQRFELLSKLGANINWDAFDPGVVQQIIDKPRDPGAQMTIFIKNGGRVELVLKQFAVWKTITVHLKSGAEFITELRAAGIKVSDWARDIMGKPGFKTLKKPRTLKLAKVTVRELGFMEKPTTDELWARIQELGGELLPPEAGPEIRICDGQENSSVFWLAMEPIIASRGDLSIFYLKRNDIGERWLNADYARPDYRWFLGVEIVFSLRK